MAKLRFLLYIIVIGVVGFFAYSNSVNPQKSLNTQADPFANYLQDKGTGAQLVLDSFSSILAKAKNTVSENILGTSKTESEEKKITAKTRSVSGNFTIAVLGDSMIHVLGPEVSILKPELESRYPNVTFTIHNAGVSGTDIEWGLHRLTHEYDFLGSHKPSVLSLKPDILVVESFAYNHWGDTQGDLDRQWLAIANIIKTMKSNSPSTKLVLAAAIAPHCPTYTDGSANLPPERKYRQCETVKKYLQNMINFATSEGYPLADAYHASLASDGNGQKKYIAGDNIHPSGPGGELFAKKVAETISKNNLLQ